jgi:hypothetical protein
MEWDWVHLVRRPLSGLLYQAWMIDECGTVGGMRIGKGNRSTGRKPAPEPLFSPQIPHDLNWDRTLASSVGSRWLTAWVMARSSSLQTSFVSFIMRMLEACFSTDLLPLHCTSLVYAVEPLTAFLLYNHQPSGQTRNPHPILKTNDVIVCCLVRAIEQVREEW